VEARARPPHPRLPLGRCPTSPGRPPPSATPKLLLPALEGGLRPPRPQLPGKGGLPLLGQRYDLVELGDSLRGGGSTLGGSQLRVKFVASASGSLPGELPGDGVLTNAGIPTRRCPGSLRAVAGAEPGGDAGHPGVVADPGVAGRAAPAKGPGAKGGVPDARVGSFLLDGLGAGTSPATPTPSQCQGVG
jgi:hypothetical protein